MLAARTGVFAVIAIAWLAAHPSPAGAGTAVAQDRPTIGLVLSGGGARGGAHVGVIKVLDELRVPVDVIAGTSMGAIVGGLYASGMDADELVRVLEDSDWPGLLADRPPRADRSFRRKTDDGGFLVNFDVGLREGRFQFPQGIVQGQRLTLALRRMVLPVVTVHDFDDLPIPFRAVATDIASGDEVVLAGGDLADAIRASMSAPGVFKPVRIDGRLLVDGGVANNLPVDRARAMGADVLIVVNVGFPLLAEEELSSAFALTNQMLTILINARAREQIETLAPGDVLIAPALGNLGSGDFNRSVEAMAIGEQAARQAIEALSALSVSEADYLAWRADAVARRPGSPVVDRMVIDIDTQLAPEVLESRLQDRSGEPFDAVALESDIARLYGLDTFETIDYELDRTDSGTTLRVFGSDKSWGPTYLRFGINLEDNFEGTSSYNFATRYTRTELNPLGGEFRADLQVGESPGLALEWYQPLDPADRWFFNPRLSLDSSTSGVFESGDQLARLRANDVQFSVTGGRNISNWGRLDMAVVRGVGEQEVIIGDPALGDGRTDIGGMQLGFGVDTVDRFAIPRAGTALNMAYLSLRDELGSDASADIASVLFLKPQTWDRHTLLHWWDVGSVTRNADSGLAPFELGGLFSLSGYERGEFVGAHQAIGRLIYYRRMTDGSLPLFDTPIYLGASVEAGNVWLDRDEARLDNVRTAGSVFAIMDTVVGPLYVAYGYGEGGRRSAYLFLGQTF